MSRARRQVRCTHKISRKGAAAEEHTLPQLFDVLWIGRGRICTIGACADRDARGREGGACLTATSVVVFGIGGVGSYAAEALARAGIGRLTLVDHDVIDATNINRQIHALTETVGAYKTETMVQRIRSINPACEVHETVRSISPRRRSVSFLTTMTTHWTLWDTVTAKIDSPCSVPSTRHSADCKHGGGEQA